MRCVYALYLPDPVGGTRSRPSGDPLCRFLPATLARTAHACWSNDPSKAAEVWCQLQPGVDGALWHYQPPSLTLCAKVGVLDQETTPHEESVRLLVLSPMQRCS
jgi:hypothetical protein